MVLEEDVRVWWLEREERRDEFLRVKLSAREVGRCILREVMACAKVPCVYDDIGKELLHMSSFCGKANGYLVNVALHSFISNLTDRV